MNNFFDTLKIVIEKIKEPIAGILVASLIIGFVVSHAHVPTESMNETIMPGDHLLVNRLPYYYRDPVRSEIAVFNYEDDYLIKRIIGLPGDVIDIENGTLYVNNKKLDETGYLDENIKTYIWSESVIKFPYKVPQGYYFMLGDNRSSSKDSRVFGPISREAIVAKASIRIFPLKRFGKIQ